MFRKPALTHEDIDSIVKSLANYVLIDNFSTLTKNDWSVMMSDQDQLTKNDLFMLTKHASNIKARWNKIHNYKNDRDELWLSFDRKYGLKFQPLYHEVELEGNNRTLRLRVPDYLIRKNFKEYNSNLYFGSLPLNALNFITKAFGEFTPHKNGVMSYLKIDDMCIYVHKFLIVDDEGVRYVTKYIYEPYKKFDTNTLTIYQQTPNYNFINEFNQQMTTRYTEEMFERQFLDLNEDELTVLKMRII